MILSYPILYSSFTWKLAIHCRYNHKEKLCRAKRIKEFSVCIYELDIKASVAHVSADDMSLSTPGNQLET